MALKLVIGNKNYSSWSMRPWLALRANDIAFEEVFIPLYTGEADKQRILSFSRAGKVPALIDGDVTIWDSLAIIEYLAERFPEKRLWPEDRASRAHARSISAEMHSGFVALAQRMRHEPAPAGRRRSRCRRMRAPISRAFSRSGANAASATASSGRSCSAPSAAPTRCLRRSCIASAPMRFRWRREVQRLHGCDGVVAGVSGMDPRRACRNHRDREVRDGREPEERRSRCRGCRDRAGWSETAGSAFIALKNLQNSRICHARM